MLHSADGLDVGLKDVCIDGFDDGWSAASIVWLEDLLDLWMDLVGPEEGIDD